MTLSVAALYSGTMTEEYGLLEVEEDAATESVTGRSEEKRR